MNTSLFIPAMYHKGRRVSTRLHHTVLANCSFGEH
jgi:hypothetical protein